MRNLLTKAIVGSGLVLGAMTASAQYQPDYRYQDRYRDQDRFRADPGRLADRVRADLDRVQSDTIPFTGDRGRIARVRASMMEFQRDYANGNYDRQALDTAI